MYSNNLIDVFLDVTPHLIFTGQIFARFALSLVDE